ncbi:hypothetical protein C8R47DRAFT_1080205 [Mycena vitilis]|nr:hypothetical protein C8R47DRAFT_1080205 [Mycena vitilis]
MKLLDAIVTCPLWAVYATGVKKRSKPVARNLDFQPEIIRQTISSPWIPASVSGHGWTISNLATDSKMCLLAMSRTWRLRRVTRLGSFWHFFEGFSRGWIVGTQKTPLQTRRTEYSSRMMTNGDTDKSLARQILRRMRERLKVERDQQQKKTYQYVLFEAYKTPTRLAGFLDRTTNRTYAATALPMLQTLNSSVTPSSTAWHTVKHIPASAAQGVRACANLSSSADFGVRPHAARPTHANGNPYPVQAKYPVWSPIPICVRFQDVRLNAWSTRSRLLRLVMAFDTPRSTNPLNSASPRSDGKNWRNAVRKRKVYVERIRERKDGERSKAVAPHTASQRQLPQTWSSSGANRRGARDRGMRDGDEAVAWLGEDNQTMTTKKKEDKQRAHRCSRSSRHRDTTSHCRLAVIRRLAPRYHRRRSTSTIERHPAPVYRHQRKEVSAASPLARRLSKEMPASSCGCVSPRADTSSRSPQVISPRAPSRGQQRHRDLSYPSNEQHGGTQLVHPPARSSTPSSITTRQTSSTPHGASTTRAVPQSAQTQTPGAPASSHLAQARRIRALSPPAAAHAAPHSKSLLSSSDIPRIWVSLYPPHPRWHPAPGHARGVVARRTRRRALRSPLQLTPRTRDLAIPYNRPAASHAAPPAHILPTGAWSPRHHDVPRLRTRRAITTRRVAGEHEHVTLITHASPPPAPVSKAVPRHPSTDSPSPAGTAERPSRSEMPHGHPPHALTFSRVSTIWGDRPGDVDENVFTLASQGEKRYKARTRARCRKERRILVRASSADPPHPPPYTADSDHEPTQPRVNNPAAHPRTADHHQRLSPKEQKKKKKKTPSAHWGERGVEGRKRMERESGGELRTERTRGSAERFEQEVEGRREIIKQDSKNKTYPSSASATLPISSTTLASDEGTSLAECTRRGLRSTERKRAGKRGMRVHEKGKGAVTVEVARRGRCTSVGDRQEGERVREVRQASGSAGRKWAEETGRLRREWCGARKKYTCSECAALAITG